MTPPLGAAAAVLPPFTRTRTTALLYASLGAFGALQVVPGAVTPALRSEFGYGYTLASLHLTAYAACGVVAGLVGPVLDRRWGRRRLLVAGLLGVAAGTAALTLGRGPAATLAAAGVAGLLGTLIILAVQAGLSDHHGDRRAVAFSESNITASVGQTVAPLVVGLGAAVLGSWRWGVLALALPAVGIAYAATRVPVPAHVPPDPLVGAASAGRLPDAARAGVLLVFLGVVAEWTVAYWGATYLRDVAGLARSSAVTAMTVFFLAMLTGRIVGGVLARTVDAAVLVGGALGLAGTGVLVQAASTAPGAAVAGLVLLGLGVSVLFPLSLSLAVGAAPDRAPVVSGRCVTAGSLAVLLGPLVVGRLADAVGLRAALLVLPVALLAAAGTLAALRGRRR